MVICEIDGKEFKNGGVLARYIKKNYGITYKEYYHKYILKTNDIPKCKCGCGEETNWTGMFYRDFKSSHHIRVKNPWGHNPKALQKSIETRRIMFKQGRIKPWCKGLSTETDERLKEYGKKISKKFTEERKKEYSIRMKNNRLNGITSTLYGPDSSQWKGGISEINNIVRSSKRLYEEWKYPILVRDGFKCTKCGKTINLHVHHDQETMSEIIRRHVVDEEPKEFELKKLISEKVVDYHINNKVSGITLCGECHNEIHPSLNFS